MKKDLTPDRLKNRAYIYKTSNRWGMHIFENESSIPYVKKLMYESLKEMKKDDKEFDLLKYTCEWVYYCISMANDDTVVSRASKRHYLANSFYQGFGISSRAKQANVTMNYFRVLRSNSFSPERFVLEGEIKSQTSKLLFGDKSTYENSIEVMFSIIEDLVANILLKFIPNQYINESISLEETTKIQLNNLTPLMHRPFFKFFISVYIVLTEIKVNLKGQEKQEIRNRYLSDPELLGRSIMNTFQRKWEWIYADSSGELSLPSTLLVHSEEENFSFVSLSRAIGVYIHSTEHSQYLLDINKTYKDELYPVSIIGNLIGLHLNGLLVQYEDCIELFHPDAKKLAFRPNLDIEYLIHQKKHGMPFNNRIRG